jgi:transposase
MNITNPELFTSLLGIANIEIVDIKKINGELLIYVSSTEEETHCHKCGKNINCFHGFSPEIKLRHLPIFKFKTYIIIKPKRYLCCNHSARLTTTQKCPWYRRKSKTTQGYENHILLSLINSTLQDVSHKEDIGYAIIETIIDKNIASEIEWAGVNHLNKMGIDEIALKKGHKDFVTIVSAYIEGQLRIIATLEDRKKQTLKDFFLSIPKRLRRTVSIICSDLYTGFINAAKEVFGKKIKVVADRFHVAKLYRKGLESLRKKEMKRLIKELSDTRYKTLKNIMWLLRYPPSELTSDQKRILKRLFNYSPQLKEAYALINQLTDIYNAPISQGTAKRRMKGWMTQVRNKGVTCLNAFLKTMASNMDIITHYFINRDNSGFVEGLNTKIKITKRRCYGITNIKHLFQRVFLDLEGYNFLKYQ